MPARMSVTSDNMVYMRSSGSFPGKEHSPVQMKNWDPFVLGPAFAMLRMPGLVCLTANTKKRSRSEIDTCTFSKSSK